MWRLIIITMYLQRNKSVNSKTGKVYTSVILSSKYREGKKVKTRAIANLSHLPEHIILGIENMLKSDRETTVCLKDVSIGGCMDYGHVSVLLQILHKLRIDGSLEKVLSPDDALLIKAMIIGKIITGGSKLFIFNWLVRESGICKLLGLDVSDRTVTDLYGSLGQLPVHQPKIGKKWFRYHKGSQRRIYLYDITSSYFEGDKNELAAYGYNRDGKKGKKQLCVGLLTTEDGFPLRIQAFKGNTPDSVTVADQILDLKREFGVEQIVFVGDRGMRILFNMEDNAELAGEDIDFITGLTHAEISAFINQGKIELNLFKRDLAEVNVDASTSLSNHGMRCILSINPELEARELHFLNNRRDRFDALLEEIRRAWNKRCTLNRDNLLRQEENPKKYRHLKTELTVKNMDGYKRRVDKAIGECGMGNYCNIETIDGETFEVAFRQDVFDRSCSLCGKYVVCSNIPEEDMTAE